MCVAWHYYVVPYVRVRLETEVGLVDLREYMSVRRAYNLVRQSQPARDRLTFEEFAVLCRLQVAGEPLKTSAIAEYQGALRPTMTHRTNHLEELGLISRGEGGRDRRNVVCAVTPKGALHVEEISSLTCKEILPGQPLSRTQPERIVKYVDALGSVFAKAGDLVLLAMYLEDSGPVTITGLVDELGLLQPTVSMSVSSLVAEGLIGRGPSRASGLSLTPQGSVRASEVAARIGEIVVKRRPRGQRQAEPEQVAEQAGE